MSSPNVKIPLESSPNASTNKFPFNSGGGMKVLNEGSKKMLMMGLEVLARHEHEQEGLEVYISEGRHKKSLVSQTLNVIRCIIWVIAIALNFLDPFVTLYYVLFVADKSALIICLSAIAILFSIIFAISISISIAGVSLIINIVLRAISLHYRKGEAVYLFSNRCSVCSFIFLGVIILVELIEETRNSCK